MINWKVRIRNKNFWLSLVPAVLLLVQLVAKTFGVTIDLGETGNNLLQIVNVVFLILAMLGIVNDPTTAGLEDSYQAMKYEVPKRKGG